MSSLPRWGLVSDFRGEQGDLSYTIVIYWDFMGISMILLLDDLDVTCALRCNVAFSGKSRSKSWWF